MFEKKRREFMPKEYSYCYENPHENEIEYERFFLRL